nr:immunoglobulin light chain junction region [Macaca mulatta]
WMIWHNNAYIF